jgi:3-hydroxyacyl-[acyl-carrier-protein] dehydratase
MDLNLIRLRPLRLSVTLQATDPCFRGHFPDNPVVPGSLLVALCLDAIREHATPPGPLTINSFSFARFARPGSYDLDILEQDDVFECLVSQDGQTFAQGRIAT